MVDLKLKLAKVADLAMAGSWSRGRLEKVVFEADSRSLLLTRNFSKVEMEESLRLIEASERPWVFRKAAYF